MAVRRVFCSYLSLLVNSKNDLALALTLDVPTRSLGRQAFTDIKHAAYNSKMSLFLVRILVRLHFTTQENHSWSSKQRVIISGATFFFLQAVTSFIRAIQLGGKGYAPAESDPLRKHVKGLSDYVQFLDNLEEILGEIPDPRYTGCHLGCSHSLLLGLLKAIVQLFWLEFCGNVKKIYRCFPTDQGTPFWNVRADGWIFKILETRVLKTTAIHFCPSNLFTEPDFTMVRISV